MLSSPEKTPSLSTGRFEMGKEGWFFQAALDFAFTGDFEEPFHGFFQVGSACSIASPDWRYELRQRAT
jgi:hypothetical protein